MFRVEKIRKNNTGGLTSSFAAHIAAMALVLTMVLGPSNALARRPPTPQNFRVTAATAYTVTVAWDIIPVQLGDIAPTCDSKNSGNIAMKRQANQSIRMHRPSHARRHGHFA
jgi:hypothetical protein